MAGKCRVSSILLASSCRAFPSSFLSPLLPHSSVPSRQQQVGREGTQPQVTVTGRFPNRTGR